VRVHIATAPRREPPPNIPSGFDPTRSTVPHLENEGDHSAKYSSNEGWQFSKAPLPEQSEPDSSGAEYGTTASVGL